MGLSYSSDQNEGLSSSDNIYRILVIEDNKNVQLLIQKQLSTISPNLHIFIAENGYDASMSFPCIIPDLIFLDLMLPELNGFNILTTIKKHSIFSEIPIIVVTAISEVSEVKKAVTLGARDYILKPVDIEILKRKMDSAFPYLEKNHIPFHYHIVRTMDIVKINIIGNCSSENMKTVSDELAELINSNKNNKNLTYMFDLEAAVKDSLSQNSLNILFDFYNNVKDFSFKDIIVFTENPTLSDKLSKLDIAKNSICMDYYHNEHEFLKRRFTKAFILNA